MLNLRTFCICLPEYPERKEKAKKHFNERGLAVEFFDGIHAEKAGLRTIHNYDVDHPGTNFNIGHKITGIALSHIMLWSALNLLWDEHYLILEDDCQFPPDWHSRLSAALKDVPQDFDMLYPGSCCCEGKPKTHIAGEVYDVKYPMCTHAFIVAKKALPVLLSTQRKIYGPIDCMLVFHTLPKLKVYTVLPRIFDQFDTIIQP
jgi:GR25 family glycosyltransferase involved in LPS biosynthesis